MPTTLAMTTSEQGMVLLAVAAVAAPLAALMFAGSAKAWRSIGKGPLAIEPEAAAREDDPAAARAVQAAEARQMLEAKAARRRRRGEAPLDVEAELRRLIP